MFYPKLTIFVGFFSDFFCIIIIKITKILIKIFMATIIIMISIFSAIRAKRRFCRPEKVGKVARIGGWVIRAMPELKRFYSYDVFPNSTIAPHSSN